MSASPAPAEEPMGRAWLAGVVVAAGALFLSTTSANVHFGDSAEGVAGVASLGILHAPGYVTWVGFARLFSELVPVGGMALRVALFSVVCATATVGFVFAIARRLGASRPGAAIGALSLAVTTSFWFYASYAKAYALTSLLIAVALWCLVTWKDDGGRWRLVVAGVVMGLSLGAAWQSMAVAVPGFALLLWAKDRRPRVADLVALAASGIAAAGAVVVWVLVRASSDPALSWGGATTVNRAIRLVLMRDFINLQGTGAGTAGGKSVASSDNVVALVFKLLRVPFLVSADLGIVLFALVVVGVAVAIGRRTTTRWWPLAVIYLANVGAVLAVIAPGYKPRSTTIGRETLLRGGGFTLAAGVVLGCLVAFGATWALDQVTQALVPKAPKRGSGRSSAQRRARQAAAAAPRRLPAWPGLAVAAVVLAGTAAYHWPQASHHAPPFASDYARNVLSSLPDDAVLMTNLLERSFALEYEQVVHHYRPDVDLVEIDKLPADWYRSEVAERLGVKLEKSSNNAFQLGLALSDELQGDRPVYYDASALSSLVGAREDLAYRAVGLVAEALPEGKSGTFDAEATAELLDGYRLDGLFDDPARLRYPSKRMLQPYVTTFSDLGIALARDQRFDEAREQFARALDLAPDDPDVKELIRQLDELEANPPAPAAQP